MTNIVTIAAPPRAGLTFATALRHALNLSPMVLVHVGALAVFFTAGTTTEWLFLPLLVYLRGLFVTVGYHRYFAHHSFKTSRALQFVMACLGCATLQQGPLWWTVYHRRHHRYTDQPGDPHSPHSGGFWWAYCGWMFIPLDPDWQTVSDLRRYPELVWLERFWQLPGLLLAGLCWWLGGWSCLCVDFCLSAVVAFQMTFAVNTLSHLVGSRRYPTGGESRNNFLLALLTMGEGWHNNHHHYPHTAQFGFFWWELDGGFRAIRVLEWLGLIWGVRRVSAALLHRGP